jgi:hypothetical protein
MREIAKQLPSVGAAAAAMLAGAVRPVVTENAA